MAQGGTTLFEFWSNSEYTFNGGLNSFNHIMYATDHICQSSELLLGLDLVDLRRSVAPRHGWLMAMGYARALVRQSA